MGQRFGFSYIDERKMKLVLLCVFVVLHVSAVFAVNHGASLMAPAVAATIYGPLAVFKFFGIPVFSAAESGGWSSPSWLGWLLVCGLWLGIWYGVAYLLASVMSAQNAGI